MALLHLMFLVHRLQRRLPAVFPTICYWDALYQFVVLFFSLATALLMFTKVLALLRQQWISVINYPDDLLLQADTCLPPLEVVEITMHFFQDI